LPNAGDLKEAQWMPDANNSKEGPFNPDVTNAKTGCLPKLASGCLSKSLMLLLPIIAIGTFLFLVS